MKPFSWFSDWAGKLGVPVWAVYVGAVVLGVLLFGFFFGG